MAQSYFQTQAYPGSASAKDSMSPKELAHFNATAGDEGPPKVSRFVKQNPAQMAARAQAYSEARAMAPEMSAKTQREVAQFRGIASNCYTLIKRLHEMQKIQSLEAMEARGKQTGEIKMGMSKTEPTASMAMSMAMKSARPVDAGTASRPMGSAKTTVGSTTSVRLMVPTLVAKLKKEGVIEEQGRLRGMREKLSIAEKGYSESEPLEGKMAKKAMRMLDEGQGTSSTTRAVAPVVPPGAHEVFASHVEYLKNMSSSLDQRVQKVETTKSTTQREQDLSLQVEKHMNEKQSLLLKTSEWQEKAEACDRKCSHMEQRLVLLEKSYANPAAQEQMERKMADLDALHAQLQAKMTTVEQQAASGPPVVDLKVQSKMQELDQMHAALSQKMVAVEQHHATVSRGVLSASGGGASSGGGFVDATVQKKLEDLNGMAWALESKMTRLEQKTVSGGAAVQPTGVAVQETVVTRSLAPAESSISQEKMNEKMIAIETMTEGLASNIAQLELKVRQGGFQAQQVPVVQRGLEISPEHQQMLVEMQTQNEQLRMESMNWKTQHEELQAGHLALKQELQAATEEGVAHRQRIESLTLQLQTPAAPLSPPPADNSELMALQQELESYKGETIAQRERIESLTLQLQQAPPAPADNGELMALQQQLEAYQGETTAQRQRIESLTLQLQEAAAAPADSGELMALQQELEAYKGETTAQRQRIESLTLQLQEATDNGELVALQQQLQAATEESTAHRQRIESLTVQLQQAADNSELTALQQELEAYKGETTAQRQRIESLTLELQQAPPSPPSPAVPLSPPTAGSSARELELEAYLQQTQGELQQHKTMLGQTQGELQSWQLRCQQNDANVQAVQAQHQQAVAELQQSQLQMREMQMREAQAAQEVEKYRGQLQGKQTELIQVNTLNTKVLEYESLVTTKQQEVEMLATQLREAQAGKSVLEQDIRKLTQEVETIDQYSSGLQNDVSSLTARLSAVAEMGPTHEAHRTLQAQNNQLIVEVEELKKAVQKQASTSPMLASRAPISPPLSPTYVDPAGAQVSGGGGEVLQASVSRQPLQTATTPQAVTPQPSLVMQGQTPTTYNAPPQPAYEVQAPLSAQRQQYAVEYVQAPPAAQQQPVMVETVQVPMVQEQLPSAVPVRGRSIEAQPTSMQYSAAQQTVAAQNRYAPQPAPAAYAVPTQQYAQLPRPVSQQYAGYEVVQPTSVDPRLSVGQAQQYQYTVQGAQPAQQYQVIEGQYAVQGGQRSYPLPANRVRRAA